MSRSEDVAIALAGETVYLLPERAMYWPAERMLLVADVHLGKSSVFRYHGLPVPGGTTADNLARLSACLERFPVDRLVCLGDLGHARTGHTESVIGQWRAWRSQYPRLGVELVPGNHDRHAGVPAALGVTEHAGPIWSDPFWLCHEKDDVPLQTEGFRITGHEHPGIVLSGNVDRIRVPCFVFEERAAVLPAFGALTGLHERVPGPGETLFAVAGDRIFGPLSGARNA